MKLCVDKLKQIKNMAQQTAVEFIVEVISSGRWEYTPHPMRKAIIEKAIQMEKDQMFAYMKNKQTIGGLATAFFKDDFEQYYNETFKK